MEVGCLVLPEVRRAAEVLLALSLLLLLRRRRVLRLRLDLIKVAREAVLVALRLLNLVASERRLRLL